MKEAFVALVAVGVLVVLLAVVFSSPDEHAVTLKSWSTADPVDFAQTAITELDGTSPVATYGPPYNSTAGAAQHIGFFEPAQWFGVHQPIDTAKDFVIDPLRTLPDNPRIQDAVTQYESASTTQQQAWTTAYEKAVANATDVAAATCRCRRATTARSATMIGGLTAMAQSGALDGTLLSQGQFYNTNYTKPLLFIASGTYLADLAGQQHLQGTQWGMMNETGNYPGQAWLWLYTMWYQVAPDEHVDERGPRGLGHHDGAHPRSDLLAFHPDPALHSPLDPGVQADLAPALSFDGVASQRMPSRDGWGSIAL